MLTSWNLNGISIIFSSIVFCCCFFSFFQFSVSFRLINFVYENDMQINLIFVWNMWQIQKYKILSTISFNNQFNQFENKKKKKQKLFVFIKIGLFDQFTNGREILLFLSCFFVLISFFFHVLSIMRNKIKKKQKYLLKNIEWIFFFLEITFHWYANHSIDCRHHNVFGIDFFVY